MEITRGPKATSLFNFRLFTRFSGPAWGDIHTVACQTDPLSSESLGIESVVIIQTDEWVRPLRDGWGKVPPDTTVHSTAILLLYKLYLTGGSGVLACDEADICRITATCSLPSHWAMQ
jgi:hypothetical protein